MNTTTTTITPAPGPETEPPAEVAAPPAEWTVQVGGAGDDLLRAVTAKDDLIVAVGSTDSDPADLSAVDSPAQRSPAPEPEPGPESAPTTDVLTAVVDTTGELRSVRSTGSTGDDAASGVTVTGEDVIACGSTSGQLGQVMAGANDLWCSLLGQDADDLGEVTQLGGTDDEEITGVAGHEENERVYASGRTDGLLPGAQDSTGRGLGGVDALVLQFGPTGTPVWARQFGTASEDAALGVVSTEDGDGVLVGYTDGDLGRRSSGARDAWISRFDPAGRQRWITQMGSAGNDTLAAVTTAGAARRGTEQFIATGTTDGDLDAGSVEPDRPGGDGLAPEPAPTPDTTGGTDDAFVAAFGSDGVLAWTTTIASDAEDGGVGVVADGSTVYVAGTTSGDLGDLLPEAGPGGGSDGFLAALDAASGEIRWVSRFGSAGDEEITGITTTEDGLLVLSGTTTGQMADTEPGGGLDGFLIAFQLPSAGGAASRSV